MPRVDYATYKVLKDKVTVSLSGQQAAPFTKIAKKEEALDKVLKEISAEKQALTAKQHLAKDMADDLRAEAEEKMLGLVDETEKLMTISVECLGSTFTLSKFTESNKDKVITPAGEIVSTDYKAAFELLMTQFSELTEAGQLILRQCSIIADTNIVKPGASRRLSVNLESIIQEGVWDKVLSIVNKLSAKFKSLFSGLKSRQNKINSMLSRLNESNNQGKIMLNKKEKQLVKEYAKKLISKRTLNEEVTGYIETYVDDKQMLGSDGTRVLQSMSPRTISTILDQQINNIKSLSKNVKTYLKTANKIELRVVTKSGSVLRKVDITDKVK